MRKWKKERNVGKVQRNEMKGGKMRLNKTRRKTINVRKGLIMIPPTERFVTVSPVSGRMNTLLRRNSRRWQTSSWPAVREGELNYTKATPSVCASNQQLKWSLLSDVLFVSVSDIKLHCCYSNDRKYQLAITCNLFSKQRSTELHSVFLRGSDYLEDLGVDGKTKIRLLFGNRSRDSLVGTATGNGSDDGGAGVRVLIGSRIFSSPSCQDRFWGPHTLLSNGYRGLFPRG
jgi:hypothetical protein